MPIHENHMFNVNEIMQLDKTKLKTTLIWKKEKSNKESSEKMPISNLESNSRPSKGNSWKVTFNSLTFYGKISLIMFLIASSR